MEKIIKEYYCDLCKKKMFESGESRLEPLRPDDPEYLVKTIRRKALTTRYCLPGNNDIYNNVILCFECRRNIGNFVESIARGRG